MPAEIRPLAGAIRPYAWGSRTALAAMTGRPVPSPTPEAELWLGAHPGNPSTVDGHRLDEVIAAEPVRMLGAPVAREFGPRLPFLLKVLAPDEPLSLQAHPDADQARAGYAAGDVNYVDPYHKPELLIAVRDFETLCGFRDPAESAALLAGLAAPLLEPVVHALRDADPARALREGVGALLTHPEPASLVEQAVAGAGRLHSRAGDLLTDLAGRYPGDVGVVVALLLNHVRLAPGEGIYMPAGNLHAYLRGVGVEAMAASDNVLRGGLTPKRVDVPELLRVLRYEVLAEPVVQPVPLAPGVVGWPTPAREFALVRALVGGANPRVALSAPSARVLFCLSGRVRAGDVELGPGESAFAPAGTDPLELTGFGEVYQATVA